MNEVIQQNQPILIPEQQPTYHELTEEEKAMMQEGFDNEMIKFLRELAKNESVADIVKFIEAHDWTDRQKKTIMHYTRIVLGKGLATTYLTTNIDLLMLKDDKALIDCDIPLGMTMYDMTPEFLTLMDMVRLHFNIESRKSKGGKFLNSIGKNTHEIIHKEEQKNKAEGFKEKIGWS